MNGVTLDAFGTPPAARDDLPASAPGANEVLVRVHASSANPVDNAIAAGMLKDMAEHEFPVILGRDYAGVVEQVGADVTSYAVGDEVYGFVGHANPTVRDGAWAELIIVAEDLSIGPAPSAWTVRSPVPPPGRHHRHHGRRRARSLGRRHRRDRRRHRRRRQSRRPTRRGGRCHRDRAGAPRGRGVPARPGRALRSSPATVTSHPAERMPCSISSPTRPERSTPRSRTAGASRRLWGPRVTGRAA